MLGLLLLVLDLLSLHELMVISIFEEDHVPHYVDFLQAFVHDLGLLEKLGVHYFFLPLEEYLLASSSSYSLELLLIVIFFNIFACLLCKLCVGEEGDTLSHTELLSPNHSRPS